MKIREMTTRISETNADRRENIAKSPQPITNDNLNQRATIPIIFKKPDRTTKNRYIVPLLVTKLPPTSRGKNKATRTPINPLITKKRSATNEP